MIGEYNIGTDPDCTGTDEKRHCRPKIQRIDIENTIIHKKFAKANYSSGYDIAIVKIKSPVNISLVLVLHLNMMNDAMTFNKGSPHRMDRESLTFGQCVFHATTEETLPNFTTEI